MNNNRKSNNNNNCRSNTKGRRRRIKGFKERVSRSVEEGENSMSWLPLQLDGNEFRHVCLATFTPAKMLVYSRL
jgi:hypothetical protein